MRAFLRRLRDDQEGAHILEFALITPLFMTTLFGGLDIAYQGYLMSVTKGAVNDASRRATVESPNLPGTGAIQDRLKQLITQQVQAVGPNATVTVNAKSYSKFNTIAKPEKLTTDVKKNGVYNAVDGDCFEDANGNGSYDTDAGKSGTGAAQDVVLYTVNVKMNRLFPTQKLLGFTSQYDITVETAVRNQPYANQTTPQTLCGK
jgi:Flp pilus assembly protein TadG